MSAIAGMVGKIVDGAAGEKMLLTMMRRGPDEKGAFFRKECCLLHSRLAIVDPEGGKQPMRLDFAGRRYTLIYNGELYNMEEIRKELENLGHVFEGYSDTEVVLHAYAQWQEECLKQLNGVFAFAVWEETERKLFLARDRIGVKPLFYKLHEGGFLFASEIKTILAYPTVKAELDEEGIAELLLLGPGRIPGSGVFCGIKELEPGCCGCFKDGKWNWHRYWKLTDRVHRDSFEDTAAYVRFLVTDAIHRQMPSDVPMGTLLSGGLDSSIISSVCAKELAARGQRLSTFSLQFENNDKYFTPGKFQPSSDNAYVAIMQEYLGSDHHWTCLTPEDQVAALQDATRARDLPGMADVDFSLLVFCSHIRQDVKVALSGECADEIFGGYPWYRDPQVRAVDGFPWAQNTKERSSFLAPGILKHIVPEDFVYSQYKKTLEECDILPDVSPEERRMKEMVNLNQRWFMQTLSDRNDRMSMYSGLEMRVPFCDYRIVEYLYGVPWEYKDYEGREKGLLRYAMKDILPEQVLWRKKSPYPKTYDPRYLQIVRDMLGQVLQQKDAPIFEIVNRKALENLMTAEYSWPWYGQLMRVPQTIAFMLQINFWLRDYNIQIK